MKKFYVIANWKANYDKTHIVESIKAANKSNCDLIIAVPHVYLTEIAPYCKKTVSLCAQDCSMMPNGSFTGEVTSLMLKDLKVSYVILGHSERRHSLYNESNKIISQKIDIATCHGLKVILCVGETLKERQDNHFSHVLTEQLSILEKKNHITDIIIAYEPVWAIGTGITPEIADIEKAIIFIQNFCDKIQKSAKILYGGSVSASNISELVSKTSSRGFLVGKSCITKDIFEIIDRCS